MMKGGAFMENWIQKPNNTSTGPQEADACDVLVGICSSNCFIDCDLCWMYVY